jgi:hypothetical protein
MNWRSWLLVVVCLIGVRSAQAEVDLAKMCQRTAELTSCEYTFRNILIHMEGSPVLSRVVLFSDNRERDAENFAVAVGLAMQTIDPTSIPDDRGQFAVSLFGAREPRRWGGFLWKLSGQGNAVRVIADR